MKLFTFIPECFKMDGGACFGVVPKSIWSKTVLFDENNLVNLSSRCLLVDTGQRKIIFDTGLGNKQSEKFFSHYFIFNRIGIEMALANNGYQPSDITDVVLTHLHFDHVGGAVKWADDGKTPVPVFPNATYYCSQSQWRSANQPNPREKASYFHENYLSLFEQGRIELVHEQMNFCNGIDLEIKNGHTRGQIIPIIEYKDRKIVFTADFIATMFNIPLAYVPSFDIDPIQSMEEKESFLKRAASDNYVLLFEHDYYNECCELENTTKGIRSKRSFTLSEL